MLLNILTEIQDLFTQMHWIVIVLLCLGVIMCLVEAVVPGFGFFGITGILCEVGGIVAHAIISGSVVQVLFLIIAIVLITVFVFLLFVRSAKYGLLSKSALVENKSALPTDYVKKAEEELKSLVGREGLTVTECRPVGKIRVGQDVYEAQAIGSIIKKGEVIKVVAIEDARIMIDVLSY